MVRPFSSTIYLNKMQNPACGGRTLRQAQDKFEPRLKSSGISLTLNLLLGPNPAKDRKQKQGVAFLSPLPVLILFGTPGRIRTCGLRIRSPFTYLFKLLLSNLFPYLKIRH
jgi:hypothetical protein